MFKTLIRVKKLEGLWKQMVCLFGLSAGLGQAASGGTIRQVDIKYQVALSEFPGATTLLTPISKIKVQAQGTLRLPQTDGMLSVFLLDRAGKEVGVDVLFQGKTRLNFSQRDSARAALASDGVLTFYPSKWRIRLYQTLESNPAFQRYLIAQQRAGGYANVDAKVFNAAQQELANGLLEQMRAESSKATQARPNTPDRTVVDREVQRYTQEVAKVAYAYLSDTHAKGFPSNDCSRGFKAGVYAVPPSSLAVRCTVSQVNGKLQVKTVFPQTGQRSMITL